MTVHHSKFCLSKHSYTESLDNAKRAAQESGKLVLMPQIGEVGSASGYIIRQNI